MSCRVKVSNANYFATAQAFFSNMNNIIFLMEGWKSCYKIINLELRWIKGHSCIEENEEANQMAQDNSKESFCGPKPGTCCAIIVLTEILSKKTSKNHRKLERLPTN